MRRKHTPFVIGASKPMASVRTLTMHQIVPALNNSSVSLRSSAGVSQSMNRAPGECAFSSAQNASPVARRGAKTRID